MKDFTARRYLGAEYPSAKKVKLLNYSRVILEASKGGTKVGRMKDPLYKDSYLGITPPTFILPFEAPDYIGPKRLKVTYSAPKSPL